MTNPSITEEDIRNVLGSYGRACDQPEFFEEFYTVFVKSSDEIPPMFTNTDMAAQKALLRNGIAAVIQFAKNERISTEVIGDLAERHSKRDLNVASHLYDFWVESLITTLRKFDPQFTPDLEECWRRVIQLTIDRFGKSYE